MLPMKIGERNLRSEKIALSLIAVIAILLLTGCVVDRAVQSNSSAVVEQTVTEKKETVTVTKLSTEERTYRRYGYTYTDGYGYYGYGGDYVYIPDSKIVVDTDYYVTLTDKEGRSVRFKVKPKDYSLFEEGKEIELTVVSYDPPTAAHSIDYFWNDITLKFNAEITEPLSDETVGAEEALEEG